MNPKSGKREMSGTDLLIKLIEEKISTRIAELEKKVNVLWKEREEENEKLLAIVDPKPGQRKFLDKIRFPSIDPNNKKGIIRRKRNRKVLS